ncbi:hypothetical protein OG21DRAFT_1490247 [Imleria badia]|nr:hypothetical protein OG21DRAFT_1490247 [Imleria badia]
MAEAAWIGLGPDIISCFEIGNEPDQYYLDFDAQNCTAIRELWSVNISKALDISSSEFQVGATVIDPRQGLNLIVPAHPLLVPKMDTLSRHAVNILTNTGSSGYVAESGLYNDMSIPSAIQLSDEYSTQVNHIRLAGYLDLWQPRIRANRPLILIDEFNSVSCSGRENVSNTFGQAMWLLDATLYAMFRGTLLTTRTDPFKYSRGQLSVYGYWDHPNAAYPAKLAILNLNIYNSTATYPRPNVTVDFSAYLAHPGQRVTARTMIAPGAEIKDANVTT